jgi:urease subunit gamma/beta
MMNLSPTEMDRLTIYTAAAMARRNRWLGIKLSHPEAVALLTDEVMTAARCDKTYAEVRDLASRLLTTDDVEPGVAEMISMIYIECHFPQGTKVVPVFEPIAPGENAADPELVPGEILCPDEDIEIFGECPPVTLDVVNTGDRDVQVRSHAHFFEVNRALDFDRGAAWGMKLDSPAGTGVRFEPGVTKSVRLVPIAGDRNVYGFAGLVEGPLDAAGAKERSLQVARARGYLGA